MECTGIFNIRAKQIRRSKSKMKIYVISGDKNSPRCPKRLSFFLLLPSVLIVHRVHRTTVEMPDQESMRFLHPSVRESTRILCDDRVLIDQCCSLSMKAHVSTPYLVHSLSHPYPCSIIAFPGSWVADE